MADYSAQKVPDLKKLLQERGLAVSGKKEDLIARLQEDDSKKAAAKPAPAEDEIDWDEDDNKATTELAEAAVVAGGLGQVDTPAAVPNQVPNVDPATTTELKIVGGDDALTAADGAVASSGAPTSKTALKPEAPKEDFTAGVPKTDAEKEAEKRAARAKRFGIEETAEAIEKRKALERAKKFGLDDKQAVVKGLDDALPERRKRGREDREAKGGRAAKRQTPDRRTEAPKGKPAPMPAKKPAGRITDDPVEKAKAEARAKRFGSAS
ncbi:hypothetical protein B0O99DRAFT_511154 [Bisporella sp. PMI_857]|nr:hypothetical protein B0O99DRAFT_511154 [Bisporella sp. PMI_857]